MSQLETQPASDIEVFLSDGTRKHLSDFWKVKPLVLVFLRHFGSPFCREQVAQLCRGKDKFDGAALQILLVNMGTPAEAEDFRRQFSVPFPIICDPGKFLYKTYGLKGGSMLQIFSPRLFLKGLRSISQGHLPGLRQGDPFQLSGVILIDRQGDIVFRYYSRDPSDYATVEMILGAAAHLS